MPPKKPITTRVPGLKKNRTKAKPKEGKDAKATSIPCDDQASDADGADVADDADDADWSPPQSLRGPNPLLTT